MGKNLEHARHRTYFLAAALSFAVLSVPGVIVLLLEGSWDLNRSYINLYLLVEFFLLIVTVAERSKMHEKE